MARVVATFDVNDKRVGQLSELLSGLRAHLAIEALHIEEKSDGKQVLDEQRGPETPNTGSAPVAKSGNVGRGDGKDGFVARAARKVATAFKK